MMGFIPNVYSQNYGPNVTSHWSGSNVKISCRRKGLELVRAVELLEPGPLDQDLGDLGWEVWS